VRRHRVPRGGGAAGTVGPADLAVGATITVYGRTFFLVDADAFTREWYAAHLPGAEQGPAQGYPSDMVRRGGGGGGDGRGPGFAPKAGASPPGAARFEGRRRVPAAPAAHRAAAAPSSCPGGRLPHKVWADRPAR
jgi:hypothetical protein